MKFCFQVGLWVLLLAPCGMAANLKAKSHKVYLGGEGITVVVVKLEKAGSKEALIQVTGTESVLDDKIFLSAYREWNGREDYPVFIDKNKHVILTRREMGLELHVPGKSGSTKLEFDQKATDGVKPTDVISKFKP